MAMAMNTEKLNWRWNTLKESLIALSHLNKSDIGNEEFKKFLSQEMNIQNMSAETFNLIMYFLLGVVDSEERDKLMRWPLINIQAKTKFRKGIAQMISEFKVKYPWAHIKTLRESYYLNPCANQIKTLDFILSIASLAIHVTLNDPELLLMNNSKEWKSSEHQIAVDNYRMARIHEEKQMVNNIFSIEQFEKVKQEICDKCIELKQKNSQLLNERETLKKQLIAEGFLSKEEDNIIGALKNTFDESLTELNNINTQLRHHHETSTQFSVIKSVKKPIALCAGDLGCTASVDLDESTNEVCDRLNQMLEDVKKKRASITFEGTYCEDLKRVKDVLIKERDARHLFLSKMSQLQLVLAEREGNEK